MITNIYMVPFDGDEIIKYVREKDVNTGEERLLMPHELLEPDHIEVGDDEAYKVNLAPFEVTKYRDTY